MLKWFNDWRQERAERAVLQRIATVFRGPNTDQFPDLSLDPLRLENHLRDAMPRLDPTLQNPDDTLFLRVLGCRLNSLSSTQATQLLPVLKSIRTELGQDAFDAVLASEIIATRSDKSGDEFRGVFHLVARNSQLLEQAVPLISPTRVNALFNTNFSNLGQTPLEYVCNPRTKGDVPLGERIAALAPFVQSAQLQIPQYLRYGPQKIDLVTAGPQNAQNDMPDPVLGQIYRLYQLGQRQAA